MSRSSEPQDEPAAEPPSPKPRKKPAPTAKRLRAKFLAHVERQIDRFDAALDTEVTPSGFDSAKVLRDLRGLKALLDELRMEEGHGSGGPPLDLVALRADLARRYAAFEAQEAGASVPDEPAAEAPSGA
ncbi:hypothetical protein [Methylobacterium sp. Leaf456]|uniref:hypothetical protein n=1 Tax=Methylobacterium sp. Leaf456 TaxID=1736382 RepID=UPI0009EC5F1E|nr:hypothetical protein [Methylobacterium sp. Leaf456]